MGQKSDYPMLHAFFLNLLLLFFNSEIQNTITSIRLMYKIICLDNYFQNPLSMLLSLW